MQPDAVGDLRRLNLGCGFDHQPGYLNVDNHPVHDPDLLADVRHLDMLPSETYVEVLAQDILEHLPRVDTLPTLREWSRLLEPGGYLVLRVPDLVGLYSLIAHVDNQSVARQDELIQCAYGTQGYDGDFHLSGFTRVFLEHCLHETGFGKIHFAQKDAWLLDVVAVKGDIPSPGVMTDTLASFAAELADASVPERMREGESSTAQVTVRNLGSQVWSSSGDEAGRGAVTVAYHWRDSNGELVLWDGQHTLLPRPVLPSSQVTISDVIVIAPDTAGTYVLDLTLVQEHISWFDNQGMVPLSTEVVVTRN